MNGWTRARGIPRNAFITTLLQDATRGAVVHLGISSGAGYLRSEDGGQSFFAPGKGPGAILSLITCPKAPKRLYAWLYSGKLVRSEELGKTWHPTGMRGLPAVEDYIELVSDPLDPGRLYLARPTRPCLWRSSDSGETWTRMDRGAERLGDIRVTLVVNRKGRKIARYGAVQIMRIEPGEHAWHEGSLSRDDCQAIVEDPHHADRFWYLEPRGLWRSELGRAWEPVSVIDDGIYLACDAVRRGYLAIVRESSGVALSADNGHTWHHLKGTIASLDMVCFAGKNIVAWDHSGLWWRVQRGFL